MDRHMVASRSAVVARAGRLLLLLVLDLLKNGEIKMKIHLFESLMIKIKLH